ncbi:MAG: GNAT family N-acetyltransferase [Demequinaceae bacterium]|nr:GNAT family N-acetyltransferase [Demequinaceae bacterium]
MTAPSGYRLVDLPRDRKDEMLEIDQWAFAFAARSNEADALAECFPFERARALEIADASRGPIGSLVAIHSSFDFLLRVPGGGTVPTAGLTWVGVHQGHRRRGLLRAMITDHFARARARGEVLSTLYAAEPPIYQKFGYGLATQDLRMKIGRKPDLREVPGSDDLKIVLDTASFELHGPVVRAFQAEFTRPGSTTVVPDSLLTNLFLDTESSREGAESLRFATVLDGDAVVAWALFRRKGEWNEWDPKGVVHVPAWGAHTAAATRRLWSVLTDFDLMVSTHAWLIAQDDPLRYLLVNERSQKPDLRDNTWLRILDVKAALEGRGYEADCDVIIEVTDAMISENAGNWRVLVSGGKATVTPAKDTKADLTIGIQELGAAYLGDTSIEALTRSTLITEHAPGAAHALGRAMHSSIAPVCNISF